MTGDTSSVDFPIIWLLFGTSNFEAKGIFEKIEISYTTRRQGRCITLPEFSISSDAHKSGRLKEM